MLRITKLFITPTEEVNFTDKELGEFLGIGIETVRDRMKKLGPDHYLTYFPGRIPSKLRRFPKKSNTKSKLNKIHITDRVEVTPEQARILVLNLILASQRNYKTYRCEESKAFLLNKGGMLQWYMEPFPGIDHVEFIRKMKKWVKEN